MEKGLSDTDGRKPNDSEKALSQPPVPVLLRPPQIPHEMPREQSLVFAVRIRRITPEAMTRSEILKYHDDNTTYFLIYCGKLHHKEWMMESGVPTAKN